MIRNWVGRFFGFTDIIKEKDERIKALEIELNVIKNAWNTSLEALDRMQSKIEFPQKHPDQYVPIQRISESWTRKRKRMEDKTAQLAADERQKYWQEKGASYEGTQTKGSS